MYVRPPEPAGRLNKPARGGVAPRSAPHEPREGADVAQLDFADISGKYVLAAGPDSCAKKIQIGDVQPLDSGARRLFGPKSGGVPHKEIVVDGKPCSGDGYMEVADIDDFSGRGVAGRSSDASSSTSPLVAVAFESQDRKCGDHLYRGGTQFYDDLPRYLSTFPDNGANADDMLEKAKPGEIYFPVVSLSGDSDKINDPEKVEASYCWYKNSDKQTDASGRDEAASASGDDPKCFPADATVELESGQVIPIHKLAVGDRVKVGPNEYSDVFMFTHKTPASDPTAFNTFVEITADADGRSYTVLLTPGHYIPHLDGDLALAAEVKVGELLRLGNGNVAAVTKVRRTKRLGLYNPQTVSGDIVVDGIVISTYTSAVPPVIAHSVLAPWRWAFDWLSVTTSAFDQGMPRLASYIFPLGQVQP